MAFCTCISVIIYYGIWEQTGWNLPGKSQDHFYLGKQPYVSKKLLGGQTFTYEQHQDYASINIYISQFKLQLHELDVEVGETESTTNGQLTAHTNLWHPSNGFFDPTVTGGFNAIQNKLNPVSSEFCF